MTSSVSPVRKCTALVAITFFAANFSVLAQQTEAPAITPIVGKSWERVKALPAKTKVHIYTDHGNKTCHIYAVADETLTCTKGRSAGSELQRTEIQKIKTAHYARSAAAGAGILGTAGAIAGAVAFHSPRCSDPNFCFNIITGKEGALGFGLGLGVIGAVIGGTTDFTRGGAIYVRP